MSGIDEGIEKDEESLAPPPGSEYEVAFSHHSDTPLSPYSFYKHQEQQLLQASQDQTTNPL